MDGRFNKYISTETGQLHAIYFPGWDPEILSKGP